jgi:hypothetical protein
MYECNRISKYENKYAYIYIYVTEYTYIYAYMYDNTNKNLITHINTARQRTEVLTPKLCLPVLSTSFLILKLVPKALE